MDGTLTDPLRDTPLIDETEGDPEGYTTCNNECRAKTWFSIKVSYPMDAYRIPVWYPVFVLLHKDEISGPEKHFFGP